MKNTEEEKVARNKLKKIMVGVEVECIINKDIINFIDRGGYKVGSELIDKDGKTIGMWDVQSDGSISKGRNFKNPSAREFVSKPFTSKKDFFRGMDRFIETFSCGGKYELHEVIEIERSCGCHIHLSKGKRKFGKTVHKFVYEKATKDFFKRIKASTLPAQLKASVLEQYYRDYSNKANEEQFKKNRGGNGRRSTEWNFCSERKNMGLEWRSFNLNGVKTWREFKLLMSIGFETVGDMIFGLNSWQKGNIYKKDIVIPELVEKNEKIIKIFNKNREIPISVKKREDEVIIIGTKDESIRISRLEDKEVVVSKRIKSKISRALSENV